LLKTGFQKQGPPLAHFPFNLN